jgi:hypothetical protein
VSCTSMASSARVIGRNIFKSHPLTQEKCFSGVVFKASVALSLRSVGDSSSILSVSQRNKSLHVIVSSVSLCSLLLITCGKGMPTFQEGRKVVHGGALNSAFTPLSTQPKETPKQPPLTPSSPHSMRTHRSQSWPPTPSGRNCWAYGLFTQSQLHNSTTEPYSIHGKHTRCEQQRNHPSLLPQSTPSRRRERESKPPERAPPERNSTASRCARCWRRRQRQSVSRRRRPPGCGRAG